MGKLSTEQILKENKATDPNSITSLSFTHKALTNVSCLGDFKNLERLDLTFNSLASLQGLELCVNLKWLCVQQNNLQSLKGIEGLTNLTVLNAGKNKLRSMDEVRNLLKLRALILNDNEIATISGLDQLKELNTLVLSRNPIRVMGNSLTKLKSISKISLSNCQLEAIDPSIKFCIGLEELRLAHNEIKSIPEEMGYNKKLHILDLGHNIISKWSDLEALSSLRELKNLNLHGNPIAEKAKLVKKMSRLVPSLQILNAKRMDKLNKVENNTVSGEDDSTPPNKSDGKSQGEKRKRQSIQDEQDIGGNEKKDEDKRENKKKEKHKKKEAQIQEAEKRSDKRSKRVWDNNGMDIIDDKDIPFTEIFEYDGIENVKVDGEKRSNDRAGGNVDSISGLVTYPSKKKKGNKNQGGGANVLQFSTPVTEVGLGGASAWDIE